MEQFFLLPKTKFDELIPRLDCIEKYLKDLMETKAPIHDWLSEIEVQKIFGYWSTYCMGLAQNKQTQVFKGRE